MKSSLFLISLLPATASASLVAWYPLDNDASDASGNGFNGSVVNGTVNFGQPGANGSTGSSAAFPDSGRIEIPFNTALNPESFTVTLWANASSTGGFASPITSRDDVNNGQSTHGYILYNDAGGNWNFWSGDGNPGWDMLDGGAVSTNTWTHLALTFDAATGTKTIWVDGAVEGTDTAPEQYSPNGTVQQENLHIGAGQDDGLNFFFSGNIDDVTIWNTALDEAAINDIRLNSIPEPTSLALVALAGLGFFRRRR